MHLWSPPSGLIGDVLVKIYQNGCHCSYLNNLVAHLDGKKTTAYRQYQSIYLFDGWLRVTVAILVVSSITKSTLPSPIRSLDKSKSRSSRCPVWNGGEEDD